MNDSVDLSLLHCESVKLLTYVNKKEIHIKILQSSGVPGLDKYYIVWGITGNTQDELCTYLH